MILQIVLASIGSSGLFSFLMFLITRKDNKKNELEQIQKQLKEMQQDSWRTQLLLLMSDYPSNNEEIMKVAEKYFTSGGNWYMTSLFKKFLTEKHLGKPEWFTPNKNI